MHRRAPAAVAVLLEKGRVLHPLLLLVLLLVVLLLLLLLLHPEVQVALQRLQQRDFRSSQ